MLTIQQGIMGARYRRNACMDFDLCDSCHRDCRKLHDVTHTFYRIQYYLLDVPPLLGEDLSMIQKFLENDSSQSFYLHFPWIFNLTIFNKLVIGTADEQSHRSQAIAISESFDDEDDAQIGLDNYIRTCASEAWSYRNVLEEVRELARMQLIRADGSQCFATIWRRLSTGLTESFPNALPDYIEQQKSVLNQKMEQYHAESITALFSAYCQQREEEWSSEVSGMISVKMSERGKYFLKIALEPGVRDERQTSSICPDISSGNPDPISDTRRARNFVAIAQAPRWDRQGQSGQVNIVGNWSL